MEAEGVTRCSFGGKKWQCGKLFPTELRDVKGTMVPLKTCPHHRAKARAYAKTPAGVATRKRHKASAKGQASLASYRATDKRKQDLKKYNASEKRKATSKRYHCTEKGRANNNTNTRKWYRKMKSEDPAKYLLFRLRKKLSKVAKLGIKSQTLSSLTDLDGPGTVQSHFEIHFSDGMSWDNYGDDDGDWHIGHRIPVACFDGSNKDDVRRCFAKDNLFPQWRSDNHQASVSLPPNLDELKHVFPAKWAGKVPTVEQRLAIEKAARVGQGSTWKPGEAFESGSESESVSESD
jgi:hypothetical protein